jgi:hypothetical protein
MAELLEGSLGEALTAAFVALGIGETPDLPAIQGACYDPGASVFDLAVPHDAEYSDRPVARSAPAYTWHRTA